MNGALKFLLFGPPAWGNFYQYSFDGHQWTETDVYIQNDDTYIITKIKMSSTPYNDPYDVVRVHDYGQTMIVKHSKKERSEFILIFRKAFFHRK